MQSFWLIDSNLHDSHTQTILGLHHLHVLGISCFQVANRRRQCGDVSPFSLKTCPTCSISAHIVLMSTCQSCSHPRCRVGFGTYSWAEQLPPSHYYENGPWVLAAPALTTLYQVPRSITSGEAAGKGHGIHQAH